MMWWNAQAVPLTRAWWNAPYYWPMHDALALTDHLAGLSPLTTPLQWLGASPLTAYNITLIASTWWCGLATHALMRRLGGSRAAAYCAGLAFAFAPYRISQLGHLQLYACWWLPLMLLALHAYYEERRARWLVLLGAAWAVQGLTNGYFLFFVPVLVGWWLLWHTRLRPGDGGDGPRPGLGAAARVLFAMGMAAAALSPFLLKYRTFMTAQGLTRTVGEMTSYSARLGSFTSVTPILRFWHSPVSDSSEQYLFPGLTVLALTAAAAFFVTGAWRDRRYLFYVSAAILMALFCAGPAPSIGSLSVLWHPYTWLTLLPGFNGLRVPSRFFMLAALCLAVAAGLSLDVLGRRAGRWRPLLVALACTGLAVDGAIAGMPLGIPPQALEIDRSRDAGARVLTLPVGDARVNVYAMYQSMAHHLPLVNGYAGFVPSHADVLEWALRRSDATVLTELRRGHPLYVVVASTEESGTWTEFMNAQADAEILGVRGGGRLYRMPAAAYAREPRPGTALTHVRVAANDDWLTADLGEPTEVRGLELRVGARLLRLPRDLAIDVSVDGAQWTRAFEQRPGGLAFLGALAAPRTIPIRVDLGDLRARYLRINAPLLGTRALTVYAP